MIDDVFAVIADPTRRQILKALSQQRRPVGELVEELGVSQPTVSKHLKVLRGAELVETEAEGQKRFYSLTPAPLGKVEAWISSLTSACPPYDQQQERDSQAEVSEEKEEEKTACQQEDPAATGEAVGAEQAKQQPEPKPKPEPEPEPEPEQSEPLEKEEEAVADDAGHKEVESEDVTGQMGQEEHKQVEAQASGSSLTQAGSLESEQQPQPVPSPLPAVTDQQVQHHNPEEPRGLLATLTRWGRRRNR